MSNFIPDKGGSILAIAGTVRHLHVICSKPFFNPATGEISVVAVNISSVKDRTRYDKTCVLEKGDHPFIRHKSFVYYKGSTIFRISKIQQGIETGEITVLENVSEQILKKVLSGFATSDFTPAKILKALRLSEK